MIMDEAGPQLSDGPPGPQPLGQAPMPAVLGAAGAGEPSLRPSGLGRLGSTNQVRPDQPRESLKEDGMSVVVEISAGGVELTDRPAFVVEGQRFTQIIGTDGEGVRTEAEPDRVLLRDEVAALPVLGEFVETRTEEGPVRGWWLGPGVPRMSGDRLAAMVLSGPEVRRVLLEPMLADARRIVTGRAGEAEQTVMVTLLAEARLHDQALRQHERWTAALVEDMHETAQRHEMCPVADALMERHGLPARSSDFDLRVEVTATLYLTRSGRDLAEAVSGVTKPEVLALLGADDLSIDVEQD